MYLQTKIFFHHHEVVHFYSLLSFIYIYITKSNNKKTVHAKLSVLIKVHLWADSKNFWIVCDSTVPLPINCLVRLEIYSSAVAVTFSWVKCQTLAIVLVMG